MELKNNQHTPISQEDSVYQGAFHLTPVWIADHPDLDDSEKMLFGRLSSLTGKHGYCFASDKYLAEKSRCKTRAIQYRLKKLSSLGFIKIISKRNGVLWDRRIYVNMNHQDFNNPTFSKNTYETHQRANRNAPACGSETHQRATYIDKYYLNKKELHTKKDIVPKRSDPPLVRDSVPVQKEQKQKHYDPPDPKPKKDFTRYLSASQRKLHDELVSYRPPCGQPLRSEDVCAWFLSKGWTYSQVKNGFEVYKQDCAEAANKGRCVKNMGGAMVAVINSKRMPQREDMEFNRSHADLLAKTHSFIEVMDKYVKITIGKMVETINFNLPQMSFVSSLEGMINQSKLYG